MPLILPSAELDMRISGIDIKRGRSLTAMPSMTPSQLVAEVTITMLAS